MSMDDQIDPRGVQRNRPEHVDALASTVISVLRGRQVVSCEGLRQFVLDHMVRLTLASSGFSAADLLAELRGHRLTVDAIIDLYVPATARLLGELWVDDRISFAEVTIGVMRLQALLSEATATTGFTSPTEEAELNTLVVVPNDEQHFLGASVVAGQMRRMGCDVAMSYDEDAATLTTRLMQGIPDLVLITCARRETLESVARTVQTIRTAAPTGPIVAVGGAMKMKEKDVIDLTGADIVTNVAEEAVAYCTKRKISQKFL